MFVDKLMFSLSEDDIYYYLKGRNSECDSGNFFELDNVGFLLINIEVIEIIIDGLTGNHRIFRFMGGFYNF